MKHYNVNTGAVSQGKQPAPEPYRDLIPFGKYQGQDIVDVPSSYLKWLCLQEWFEAKYRKLLAAVDEELKFRDKRGCHFEEDGGRRG